MKFLKEADYVGYLNAKLTEHVKIRVPQNTFTEDLLQLKKALELVSMPNIHISMSCRIFG